MLSDVIIGAKWCNFFFPPMGSWLKPVVDDAMLRPHDVGRKHWRSSTWFKHNKQLQEQRGSNNNYSNHGNINNTKKVAWLHLSSSSSSRCAVHQTPDQSDGLSGEHREAGLCRPGGDGARHRVAEGRRETLQHRPDVHHPGGAALGDVSQVGQQESNWVHLPSTVCYNSVRGILLKYFHFMIIYTLISISLPGWWMDNETWYHFPWSDSGFTKLKPESEGNMKVILVTLIISD